MSEVDDLRSRLLGKKKKAHLPFAKGLSTGSTLLNLAISGKPDVGFLPGYYYLFVGDTNSGKTFISLNAFAEASINPKYRDYRLIFDNAENGALMEVERFYGKKLSQRIETWSSVTVEQFFDVLDDAIQYGRPFIYLLDSIDVLTCEADQQKFAEAKQARRKGKEISGSYGVQKAKVISNNLRGVVSHLQETGSILIIINQSRDSIGGYGSGKTRSGGRAPVFYSSVTMWSSVYKRLKRTVKGKPRSIGTLCKIHIERNRVTANETTVLIPIYRTYGIDDVGSMVDYLVEEKHWSRSGVGINAKDFAQKLGREELIHWIEEKQKEQELKGIVADVWQEIENQCQVNRKCRYE